MIVLTRCGSCAVGPRHKAWGDGEGGAWAGEVSSAGPAHGARL